uniref:Uncharacterized protein n=1 Tax=Dechloromonas aromatica (strain RCB) TaxID=159087 RepID=Q47E59_DECAR
MVGDNNGDTPDSSCRISASQRASRFAAEAMKLLPTLQCNALRKVFDRHDFLPEEVASLGYKRLQQAEGIGNKGLAAITAWLNNYGFELNPPPLSPHAGAAPKRTRQRIEQALRLLRTHGYEIVPLSSGDGSKEGRR